MSRCVKILSKSIVIAFFVVVFIKEITANANDLVNQEIKIHQNEINNIKELISKNGKARVYDKIKPFNEYP